MKKWIAWISNCFWRIIENSFDDANLSAKQTEKRSPSKLPESSLGNTLDILGVQLSETTV